MGVISTKAHTVIGLIVGVLLIFASSIFGFTDNMAASMVALWVGIFIIVSELVTTSPYSPLKLVPMKAHIVIDVVTGVFLLLSPWLFSFMDNDQLNQWVPHVVVGLLVVGYALLTNTADARDSVATRDA
jgi:hypothetical protein